MTTPLPWRGFYAIVDPEVCERSPLDVAEGLLAGGAAVLQLRAKGPDDRETLALARALRARCAKVGVPFVMNDRVDLALLAGADGLHLGQDDLPITEARALFRGPIGVSTHDLTQLREAIALGADLCGFGPVFPTGTKLRPDPVVGLDGLREACALSTVPIVAIGGISLDDAPAVRAAGAALVAAIGATCRANDPGAAARAFGAAMGVA
ncbi:MAG: thiamine phosphate synthase [Myxococcales bacterium]|nr:thiamine phosphate synthase [Myxococcales bacterium]